MKFIVFASCIHVDILSQKGVDKFVEEVTDFFCMIVDDEGGLISEGGLIQQEDYFKSLKKVERYGSFIFVSEDKYGQLRPYSDEDEWYTFVSFLGSINLINLT